MATTLPTLYEYYSSSGINAGLSVSNPYFTLNNKNITLYSGAMHYFRVPPEYWRDRLRKMRAAGLNAVETYVPWNLHEPQIGNFDFGRGNSEMSDFLDLERYLRTAQEEDLFVIVRPGPYICAEWEFGGLPSWLLREKDIKIRTSDSKFMKHVARYFRQLLTLLAAFQFTLGGPVIGFQVENEYGSTEWKSFIPDKTYIQQLKDLMTKNGVKELLFTSDSPSQHGDVGTLPELFQTANFAKNAKEQFDSLKKYQKNKPFMAMEYWTGWFDHWSEKHSTRNNTEFREVLEEILIYPASVNMYMFHGGTNWGFFNGANVPSTGPAKYQPDTTSYDYDAPLSEAGDYTEKYHIVKQMIENYNQIATKLPPMPEQTTKAAYPKIKIDKQITWQGIIDQLPDIFESDQPIPMELLPMNNNSGQSYGYVVYRKMLDIEAGSVLKIKGYIHDSALVLINGELISPPLSSQNDLNGFGYWRLKDSTITLPETKGAIVDIVVENWGRNNFGRLEHFKQFKGLSDKVFLNGKELRNWTIMPMEFKKSWTNSLFGWTPFSSANMSLQRADLHLDHPVDTFVDMTQWNTGIVIVNGFVLGRYMHLGPQQALYLPAPLLKKGPNQIIIFEHFTPAAHVSFSKNPIYTQK